MGLGNKSATEPECHLLDSDPSQNLQSTVFSLPVNLCENKGPCDRENKRTKAK